MTTIITGFSPKGHGEYGQKFLDTFDRFWPKDVALQCYVEQEIPMPREAYRSLWDCKGVREFIRRHATNARHCGREEFERWRPKDRGKAYAYRWDAVKFCRQLFIPEQAARELPDGEVMAWLDGDVMSFAKVPPQFIEGMLGDSDLCYLGRTKFHSEIGFWAVRLNEQTRRFLKQLAEIYRTDEVFGLWEWHSAYVWDHLRERSSLNCKNLTPRGYSHVWAQSPLMRYTDHLKGDVRKKMGRSIERPAR